MVTKAAWAFNLCIVLIFIFLFFIFISSGIPVLKALLIPLSSVTVFTILQMVIWY